MASNYKADDPILGQIDLDDKFVTDAWLIDQFVGNQLWAWGVNVKGQLGNNTITSRSSPIQIGSLVNWNQVSSSIYSSGEGSSSAIKTDGTLWTWGLNYLGQLGLNDLTHRSSPTQVGALTDWKLISCGSYHMAAIKTDGTLWTWGSNSNGELGQNNTTPTLQGISSPVKVGALTNWKLVSIGNYHMAAIKTDGTLWTCGYNNNGQLGQNNITHRSSPVQVGSLTTWKLVSVGRYHTAAIKTDGTLWTWGLNSAAQLGLGNLTHRSSPTQLGALTNWKQVSCGYSQSLAIKTDGTLWAWGSNDGWGGGAGLLGLGNNTNYSSPVQVGTLTNWKQVVTGGNYSAAIKTDGTLWAWGSNAFYGQLGQNNLTNYSSPVQVGTLTNWKQVSGGWYTTLAVTYSEIT